MHPDSLTTIYNDARVIVEAVNTSNPDSVWVSNLAAYPDSLWVTNLPQPSLWETYLFPALWIVVTAVLTYLFTRRVYRHQAAAAEKEKLEAAYRLFWAICDEMRRTRRRVQDILEFKAEGKQMKGPIITGAKDALIGRLAELMPTWWEPNPVFRYYELLELIAVHHNTAVGIPVIRARAAFLLGAYNRQGDNSVLSDHRRRDASYEDGVAFARQYFDTDDRDNLTDHYINAVEQLKKLADEVNKTLGKDFSIPSKENRIAIRRTIEVPRSAEDNSKTDDVQP